MTCNCYPAYVVTAMQLQNVLYFLVWAGLIFFVMRFLCGAHIMGHGHRHPGSHSSDHGTGAPPEKAVDPVCGMTVATATAKSAAHHGHIFYFCSSDCRTKFEAAPEGYAASTDPSREHEGHHHDH
jgi:YHS domain-containing protein